MLGSTILVGLMAAIQLPIVLTKLSYLIDNPWTVSLDRANAAGLILADSLIDRNLKFCPCKCKHMFHREKGYKAALEADSQQRIS